MKKIELSEHQEQCSFVNYLSLKYPSVLFYSIPNGGHRNILVAAKLKREGVKAGVPDIFIAEPVGKWHGLYIEIKKESKGYVTQNQKDVMSKLEAKGYKCVVAKGCSQAIEKFEGYLNEN